MAQFALASAALLAGPAVARPAKWQIAGKTYNSVAFVDLASTSGSRGAKNFTAIRISGQPASDGWASVVQKLTVNCDTRAFIDAGSRIEKTDGRVIRHPGFGATQWAFSRGVFSDMFEIVCNGRTGISVANPKAWTGRNLKPGQ